MRQTKVKRKAPKKRYFYVVYWTTIFAYNSECVVLSGGGYLNKQHFESRIANTLGGIRPLCMITNIIELSKKDYDEFTHQYEPSIKATTGKKPGFMGRLEDAMQASEEARKNG